MIKFIQKQMNKKGFTLVELIIVIAVMAILAAIVVPRMSGITDSFKEKADERVCENYARDLEVLIQLGNDVDGDSGTSGTQAFGLVSEVITEAAGIDPKSNAAAEYYFVYSGTTVTVFVSATAPTDATTPTTGVFVTRTNATVID